MFFEDNDFLATFSIVWYNEKSTILHNFQKSNSSGWENNQVQNEAWIASNKPDSQTDPNSSTPNSVNDTHSIKLQNSTQYSSTE